MLSTPLTIRSGDRRVKTSLLAGHFLVRFQARATLAFYSWGRGIVSEEGLLSSIYIKTALAQISGRLEIRNDMAGRKRFNGHRRFMVVGGTSSVCFEAV